MNRKDEHGRIVCHDRCGAIALVHIEIQDRGATDSTLRLRGQRGYRTVVEHAVAFAVIAEGVMGAAAEDYGNAYFKRGATGFDSGAGRVPGSLDHLRRPRKADPADLGARKFSASRLPQMTGVMSPQDVLIGCGMRYGQRLITRQPGLHQALAQK